MVARVLIGQRSGDYGIWVSKPGYDVFTATANQLIMSMGSYTDQVLLVGYVAASSTVPVNLTQRPLVMLVTYGGFSTFGNCATRPGPLGTDTRNNVVTSTASTLYFTLQQPTMYLAFRRTF